jgi:hypothetical protein
MYFGCFYVSLQNKSILIKSMETKKLTLKDMTWKKRKNYSKS